MYSTCTVVRSESLDLRSFPSSSVYSFTSTPRSPRKTIRKQDTQIWFCLCDDKPQRIRDEAEIDQVRVFLKKVVLAGKSSDRHCVALLY